MSYIIERQHMTEQSIKINNKKIWNFFKERHPTLNIEDCILLFIDLIEKLTENQSLQRMKKGLDLLF